jgi:ABC-type nitrate/sulfonate/bicarbonate transport system permease component
MWPSLPTWLFGASAGALAGLLLGLAIGYWAGFRSGHMTWRAGHGLDPFPRKAVPLDVERTS